MSRDTKCCDFATLLKMKDEILLKYFTRDIYKN